MTLTTYKPLDNVQLQKPLTTVGTEQSYATKALNQYNPSYNLKIQGLENTLRNNLSNLESSKSTIDANYNKAIDNQNLNNKNSLNNINEQALSRGLSRSSIVTSGLASADLANNRAIAGIQANKTNALNNVAMQQANASADTDNQLNTMAANKLDEVQTLADKLKATDKADYNNELNANRNFYMQQLGYNNQVNQMNDANYWKNQDQNNWQKSFDNNNYWKGIEQSNADRSFNLQKTNADRSFDLEKTNSDRNYGLQKQAADNSKESVNKRVSDAATEIYGKIYGSFNNNKDARDYLSSNKARVIAQMTQAGMSASDALAYYNNMYADLSK